MRRMGDVHMQDITLELGERDRKKEFFFSKKKYKCKLLLQVCMHYFYTEPDCFASARLNMCVYPSSHLHRWTDIYTGNMQVYFGQILCQYMPAAPLEEGKLAP